MKNKIQEQAARQPFSRINMKYAEQFEVGNIAHEEFKRIAKSKGYSVKDSSKEQDIYDHIDMFISKSDVIVSLDIKAMKKLSRSDSTSQDRYVYVEFKNVLGREGWLYGKADCIVFETKKSFIIVGRKNLAKYCEQSVEKKFVKNAYDAAYKLYTRQGRKDLISLIELNKIPDTLVWYK